MSLHSGAQLNLLMWTILYFAFTTNCISDVKKCCAPESACTWKLVVILFFNCFQPFLLTLKLFQGFHILNQEKTSENKQKTQYFLHFVYSSKLVDMQTLVHSLRLAWGCTLNSSYFGWLFFLFIFRSFFLILEVKSLKKV